jgi:hypothetical protein
MKFHYILETLRSLGCIVLNNLTNRSQEVEEVPMEVPMVEVEEIAISTIKQFLIKVDYSMYDILKIGAENSENFVF